jgi:cell wall-associated NlpC family hydrolase
MRRTAAILAALLAAPAAARAGTTVTEVSGVQIIVSKPDAAPAAARRPVGRRASKPAAAAATTPAYAPAYLPGAETLLRSALSFVGTPYVWGGAAPGGFDCSGFTYYLFRQLGIRIPRTADVQFAAGRPVYGDPLPGDLVFFQTYDYGASHVGIYLGGGRFVNAIGENVHVTSFGSSYFRERYLGARRFLPG